MYRTSPWRIESHFPMQKYGCIRWSLPFFLLSWQVVESARTSSPLRTTEDKRAVNTQLFTDGHTENESVHLFPGEDQGGPHFGPNHDSEVSPSAAHLHNMMLSSLLPSQRRFELVGRSSIFLVGKRRPRCEYVPPVTFRCRENSDRTAK